MTADPPASQAGAPATAQTVTGAPAWELFLVGAHGPEATVQYAVAAERAGFDGVWLAEHHFISYGQVPSATTLAGHILGRTDRIAVGTAACVLSARHPVALGEEAALLDALAPGRFRLGVARGGPWVELEVFGTGLGRYQHGFPEGLDLLHRWLSGAARVGAGGDRFAFREVAVVPRPPRPVPLWVAATSRSTMELAAARGLPLLLGVHDDDNAKAAMLARYAQVATDHGHDPAGLPHASVQLAYLGDPAELRPPLAAWLATTREYVRLDSAAPTGERAAPTRDPAAPTGERAAPTGERAAPTRDPAAYAEHLLRIHPVGEPPRPPAVPGIRHVLLMVEAAGRSGTAEQIARLGAALG